jgi:hypothetical protein
MADQILASAAWYLPVLFVGRASEPAEFGVFLIAYGALAMAMAASRAMFGVVIGMDLEHRAGRGLPAPRHDAGGVLVLATATSLVMLVSAVLVPAAGGLVALLALAAAVVLLQDLARYTAVAAGRPDRALLVDAVWLFPSLGVLVVDLGTSWTMSATVGMTIWVASMTASLVVAAVTGLVAPPRFGGLVPWWLNDARRHHLGADSLLSGLVPVANGWIAALVGGAAVVASVRGSAMLFAPIATLMLAMTLAAVPEARRRGGAAARQFLLVLTGVLLVSALAWGTVTLVLPDQLGRELLGDSWHVAEPVIPLVCLEYVGLTLWAGGAAMLRYASATRAVLRVRLAYAPAAVVLPPAALWLGDDPRFFAGALALLAWAVGGTTMALGLRAMRATHGPPGSTALSQPVSRKLASWIDRR